MELTENTIIRSDKRNGQNNKTISLIDVLGTLDINTEDFVNALGKFITSKSFEKLITKSKKQDKADNETDAYPQLHLHVLTNFILNSEVSEAGYNAVIDQFLSGCHDDHHINTPVAHC